MTNPTSNFGWQMPTSTDLVTDLPADFEVFGQAVDTALADLKGGTTGQVLKKNTDTDMDFVWGADSAGMTNPMTTTGDTIYSSSGSTPARLGIGSTGQVLTVAAGVPSWATASSGGLTLISTTSIPAAASVTISSIPQTYTYLYGIIYGIQGAGSGIDLNIEPNSVDNQFNATINEGSSPASYENGRFRFTYTTTPVHTTGDNVWAFRIDNYASTSEYKVMTQNGGFTKAGGSPTNQAVQTSGFFKSVTEITSLKVMTTYGAGFAAAGSVLLYGGK
jgi:hypothetical protein